MTLIRASSILRWRIGSSSSPSMRPADFALSVRMLCFPWASNDPVGSVNCVGDIIFSGTPDGVGSGRKPPKYIEDGWLLESSIEGLGRLANLFKK